MNIGWIYPHRERCGIAIYSRKYIATAALADSVVSIDPQWWIDDRRLFLTMLEQCDIVHIQYDSGVFMHRRHNFYRALCAAVAIPLVVSLHEIYKEDPFVFPRWALRGYGPILLVRRILYDYRHPLQRSFELHVKQRFYAQRLIVHHEHHRDILTDKGIDPSRITVIPVPVTQTGTAASFIFPTLPRINFGAVGFINPTYDYELLFSVLAQFSRPWTFTWIGGIHPGDDGKLLDSLKNRISSKGWGDRFFITGWVSEAALAGHLASLDMVLALFAVRSSSASIAVALGALKPVYTTRLPLTEEIADYLIRSCGERFGAPLIVMDSGKKEPPKQLDPAGIVAQIEFFLADEAMQKKLFANLVKYNREVSFERCGVKLMDLYRELLGR